MEKKKETNTGKQMQWGAHFATLLKIGDTKLLVLHSTGNIAIKYVYMYMMYRCLVRCLRHLGQIVHEKPVLMHKSVNHACNIFIFICSSVWLIIPWQAYLVILTSVYSLNFCQCLKNTTLSCPNWFKFS